MWDGKEERKSVQMIDGAKIKWVEAERKIKEKINKEEKNERKISRNKEK